MPASLRRAEATLSKRMEREGENWGGGWGGVGRGVLDGE